MPAKQSHAIHISVHPREGVNDVEVGAFAEWVGAETTRKANPAIKHCMVTEVNSETSGEGRHIHIALYYTIPTTQDNVKRRMLIALKHIFQGERWEHMKHALHINSHPDINQLVGGYHTKDSKAMVHSIAGFKPEELLAGKAEYTRNTEAKDKRTCSKTSFIPRLYEAHMHLACGQKCPDAREEYNLLNHQGQVKRCFSYLVRQGYKNYVMTVTQIQIRHIVEYWEDLISTH